MTANQIMGLATLAIVCLLAISCSPGERITPIRTVEVKTAITEIRPVPEELKRKPVADADLPLWVAPSNPKASSCLTPEGEIKKRLLDMDMLGKLDAWEKWGMVP